MQVCIVEIDAVAIAGGAAKTFFLSDIGYFSLSTDPSGPICYLPLLLEPLQCDRELPISPESGRQVGATWGDITIVNPRDPVTGAGYWDAILPAYAVAGRGVRVKIGQKAYDQARGYNVDPSVSTFKTIFSGIALDWVAATPDTISVRIRDNLAVVEMPVQTRFYAGTGGAAGTSDIAGQPLPMVRGTAMNFTPVLIDPANLVYQLSDEPVSAVSVYDGGVLLTVGADFTTYSALIAASIAASHYVTSLALGMIRLPNQTAFGLTCDAFGAFPAGYTAVTPMGLALGILQKDAGYAGGFNATTFNTIDSANNYQAGLYTGTDTPTVIDLMGQFLGSIGACVGTDLNGTVDFFQIAPPSALVYLSFDETQIIDCESYDLPDSVITPNWRRTLTYNSNYTVQSGSEVAGTLGSVARLQYLANPYSKVVWTGSGIKSKWLTAQDAPLVESKLLNKADAQAVVNLFGALWGAQRYLFDLTFPMSVILAAGVDLGDVIQVTFPTGQLVSGPLCLIVGFNIDVGANTIVLKVLL